ncbi:MAG TPA: flagellar hook capping FlgD N-terminal domain-containing protein [Bacilli bacterium]
MAGEAVFPQVSWPYYDKRNVDREAGNSKNLGKDEFMKILIAQLSNQDPMQPLQDQDFIAQMAQFTTLEQTMNMASEIRLLRQSLGWSASLLGKTVTWQDLTAADETAQMKSGVVSAIVIKDGVQHAQVGEEEIPLDQIVSITDTEGSQ